ncbi:tripartite tricarboxylate transporter substrate binding protein [Billgrantia pellis]|uniref:Tripartite tricarboxylate transporter substrate binding protein n=1 Tax=Billgrantia pellis TaxID=2606936 RepID=A0A7V7G0F3_9GAMM|nr:tripartite tricarboxylate transporter substrate binding protein [Halomonas pellis]KAA0011989.1 tripartite tricarboxylate transporter substrate binding protein [Halomonas pellis]
MFKKSILATSLLAVAATASADWPEKPLELIVAYSAGGGTDVTARVLQPLLEKELGQSVVVVNRPGAGGEVGHAALASAEPDGYTIGIVNLPPMLTIPITRDASFNVDDIIPVAGLVQDPSAISVPSSSPFQTLDELVAFAKENPGAVTVGTTGVGTDDHLAVRYLAKEADITLTHVPFAGAGPARTALLGSHVSAAALNLGEAMPAAEEGKVRILAQFGTESSELAPEVPTALSLGFDVAMLSQRGLGLPAGVDPAIVARLSEAVANVANDEAFITRNHELYTEVSYMSADDFAAHIESLSADYQTLWDESPWQ